MVASSLVRRRWRRCGLLSSGEKVNRLRAVCPALQGNRPHRAGHMLKTGSVETGSGLSLPHPSNRGGAQRAAPAVAPAWGCPAPSRARANPTGSVVGPQSTDSQRFRGPGLSLLTQTPDAAKKDLTPEP